MTFIPQLHNLTKEFVYTMNFFHNLLQYTVKPVLKDYPRDMHRSSKPGFKALLSYV